MTRGRALTLLGLLAVGLLVVIVRAAWLCDDAYITMRTVDNIVHGYGPRWNIAERVQAYTHPLWMGVLVPAYLATGSARVTLLVVSFVFAAAALTALAAGGARRPGATAAVLFALAGSKSFVEYSTSGLEEPLLFFLLAAVVLKSSGSGPRTANALVLLSGLVFLTRMDAVLLVAPVTLAALAGNRRAISRWTGLAALPIVLWLVFATIYYGVPFPNTAYAKLGHGAARIELLTQGGKYVADFFLMDPAGAAILCAGLVTSLVRNARAIGAGILLWMLYIVWIGGDFMSGRLLAPAVWTAAVAWSRLGPALDPRWGAVAGIAAASLAFLSPAPALWGQPVRAGDGRTEWRITDERQFYFPTTGFMTHGWTERAQEHPWPRRVLAARDRGANVQTFKWVGFAGYFGGPGLHLIDEYALTDPLLARLPALPDWAPGHFLRKVPAGYAETVAGGQNRIEDPAIARYYARLVSVTRDPLFSRARLEAILWVNLRQPRLHQSSQ